MGEMLLSLLLSSLSSSAYTLFAGNVSCTPIVHQEDDISRLISGVTHQTSPVIVYEESYEHIAESIRSLMDENNTLMFYDYSSFITFLGLEIKQLLVLPTLKELRDHLTFMLICGIKCVDIVMTSVTELDNTAGHRSVLRHFSTWLIMSLERPEFLNTTMDNVSWMRLKQKMSKWETITPSFRAGNKESELENPTTMYGKTCPIEMYTLLWMPDGRQWSCVQTLNMSYDRIYTTLFPNTLRGLNGRQLILSALEWAPFTKRQNTSGKITYIGAGVDIIDSLGERFNFSYGFVEPSDNLWGQQISENNWTGVIGKIQRWAADMSVVPHGVTLALMRAFDVSSTLGDKWYTAIYKRRSDNLFPWFYLLSRFTWQVYLYISVSLLWILCLIIFMHKLKIPKEKNKILSICLETGINVPLRQAIMALPKNVSSRIVIVTWCLFCLVMTAVYSATLVSVMAFGRYVSPFTSLKELAEQDEYRVGVYEGASAKDILKNSDDPAYKRLYNNIKTITLINKKEYSAGELVETGFREIMEGKFVLLAADTTKHYFESRTCDIVAMKERLFPIHVAFLYPRYSPLRKLFDKQLLHLRESGLIDRWMSNWKLKSMNCDKPVHVPHLQLDHFKTVLSGSAAGILLATIVLFVERFIINRT